MILDCITFTQEIAMFTKQYDYEDHFANTLDPEDIGTHPDGWTVSGEINEDYFEWVNEFEASHPRYGRVWGDFEYEVHADSEEGFNDFVKYHPPHEWDYWDI
jgi:hypothetical protein